MDRTAFARHLRQEQTLAEKRLWDLVRSRRLEGFKFRRQFPIDRYVADFVCMDARLVVELDGDVHNDEEVQQKDIERTAELERCGYLVVRFPNALVLEDPGEVCRVITQALKPARP